MDVVNVGFDDGVAPSAGLFRVNKHALLPHCTLSSLKRCSLSCLPGNFGRRMRRADSCRRQGARGELKRL
eukprot:284916-Hanusia_phi.AAC.1